MAKTIKSWGFDTRNIDKNVRSQDDFYNYANGKWFKRTKIPADEQWWGAFIKLRYETEHQVKALVDELLQEKHPRNSIEQQITDYFRSAMDLKRRNVLGIKPIQKDRAEIRTIGSVDELVAYVGRSHRTGSSAFFSPGIDFDDKNSEKYLFQLRQGGLGLPEREYYLLDKPEQKRVRDAYALHIQRLLRLSGMSPKEAAHGKEVVLKIETLLAKSSMNKVDVRDVDKTYKKVSISNLSKEVPNFPWKIFFMEFGGSHVREVNLAQPKFFTDLAGLLRKIPLEEWKLYLEWHLIADAAGLLSEPFIKANFEFWGKTMSGNKKMKPLWRRALASTNGALGEAIGKLYVEKYFPSQSKKAIDELVSDLFVVYEERIKNLDWMSPKAKKKAVTKLRTMNRKIGYPSKWKSYKGLVIEVDDYFGNATRVALHEHRRVMKRINNKVDRSEWFMYPQTVNAYHYSNLNEIVFPAAILQFPFFDLDLDAAINYSGIGYTIGHEMTHGFDDQGSKFDEKGNRNEWWTPIDRKKFIQKSKILINQYNQFHAADDVMVNGALTLGENIADLGGLNIAYDAYQLHLKKTGRKDIDGFTPEQRFFLGFAQQEQEMRRPEFMKMAALNDPHSPAHARVNGPLANFEPFYQTFGVKKGDKLYREPKDRAKIW